VIKNTMNPTVAITTDSGTAAIQYHHRELTSACGSNPLSGSASIFVLRSDESDILELPADSYKKSTA
jgi:hypothetical protein